MKHNLNAYIPLITALFIAAHTLFLKSGGQLISDYLLALTTATLHSSPLFIATYFSINQNGFRQNVVWSSGFILYPFISITLFNSDKQLAFSLDEFVIFWGLYLLANFNVLLKRLPFSTSKLNLKKSFNLSQVIVGLLITASIVLSLVISADPTITGVTNNKFTISIAPSSANLTVFASVLLQLLILSSLIWAIYFISSRLLIKLVLARHGVFAFICSVIIGVLVLTPVLFSISFLLPMYEEQATSFLSNASSIFQKENYQMVLLAFIVVTPLILIFEKPVQEQELQQLAEEKNTSELKRLQQEVNPHFLFNSLNNIYAHSLSGSPETPKLISGLSNMLRYTVYEGQKEKVFLTDEIKYLKNFIDLQSIRARENLTLTVSWPEEVDETLTICPLLLIIIFENAFKHSIEKTSSECTIDIILSVEKGSLKLLCNNTFVTQDNQQTQQGGLGLNNLQKRLNLIYPQQHKLTSKQLDSLWCVELTIELNK